MHTQTYKRFRGLPMLLAGLAALAMLMSSAMAFADSKPTDWQAKDVKGKMVKTSKYRGKVTMVIINSPDKRDDVKPVSKALTIKYGNNKKVDQITLVDLTDAPLTWKAAEAAADEVTSRISKTHDRTVDRMNKWLKESGQKPIKNLSKKLHIVLDWDGKLIKKYNYFDTKKHITIVLLNHHGDPIGSFKANQLGALNKAVTAALAEIEE